MVCSGADGGKHESKGNSGLGIAFREFMMVEMDKSDVAVECISPRFIKFRIQHKEKFNGVFCIVGYVPILGKSNTKK